MRAVTLADPYLVDYLKRHFVLLWHNQAPEVDSPPTPTSREEAAAYPEGSGGGNLRAYFCTAEGSICYYLEGYWGPERFLARSRRGHEIVERLTSLPQTERPAQAGRELTQQLWDLGQQRRQLRDQQGDAVRRKGSAVALEDAALHLLERSVLTSADLFAQPMAPILAELVRKNRLLDAR